MVARVLTFEQAIEWNRLVVWVQFRELTGCVAMTYDLEHVPFVRYKSLDGRLNVEVRREYYGKTWRCFGENPLGKWMPPWEPVDGWEGPQGGNAIQEAGAE